MSQVVANAMDLMRNGYLEEAEGSLAAYNQLTNQTDHFAVALEHACRLAQAEDGDISEETLTKLLGSKHLGRVYETISQAVGAISARISVGDVIDREMWQKLLTGTKEKAVLLTDREHLEAYRKRGKALLDIVRAKLPGHNDDKEN